MFNHINKSVLICHIYSVILGTLMYFTNLDIAFQNIYSSIISKIVFHILPFSILFIAARRYYYNFINRNSYLRGLDTFDATAIFLIRSILIAVLFNFSLLFFVETKKFILIQGEMVLINFMIGIFLALMFSFYFERKH